MSKVFDRIDQGDLKQIELDLGGASCLVEPAVAPGQLGSLNIV